MQMLKKLQKYIEDCYNQTKRTAETWRDIENGRARAYGALIFCIDNNLVEYNEIEEYWNVMWERFYQLNNREI